MTEVKRKQLHVYDHDTIKWSHEGKRYCLHIQVDEYPEDPRNWSNLCTFAMWHRRYSLGDDTGKMEAEDFWRLLVGKHVDGNEILEASVQNRLEGIRSVRKPDGTVDIYETYKLRTVVGCTDPEEVLEYEGIPEETAADYILDDMTIRHCMTLLEPYIEWRPVWMYEHGGITISCGAREYPYNDRWDSGCVGWAIVFKDTIMTETVGYVKDENGEPVMVECKHDNGPSTFYPKTIPLTDDTWRERAGEIIEGEIEVYDDYLRGDVFGFTLYEAEEDEDQEEPEWVETDSCWGFYGSDIFKNGIISEIGCGLREALSSDEFESGTATLHTTSYYTF